MGSGDGETRSGNLGWGDARRGMGRRVKRREANGSPLALISLPFSLWTLLLDRMLLDSTAPNARPWPWRPRRKLNIDLRNHRQLNPWN